MNAVSEFGTDPSTLEHDDLISYTLQLIDTVLRWQCYAAQLQGKTRDQMFEAMKRCEPYPNLALATRLMKTGDKE